MHETHLRIDRDTALNKVFKQYEKGIELSRHPTDYVEERRKLSNLIDAWVAYTWDVLTLLFTDQIFATRFSNLYPSNKPQGENQEEIEAISLKETLNIKTQYLYSLFEDIELIPESENINKKPLSNIEKSMDSKADSKIVFVIHGRNLKARKALFQFSPFITLAAARVGGQAIELTGKSSPYVGEILDAGFNAAQAAIVLFTPDDEARLLEQYRGSKEPEYEVNFFSPQARPNVIFEAGMAMGKYPERTILLELGELRPISDITGRHVIRMNNSIGKRQDLANRLKNSGCAVNLIGDDWHDEGNFEIPLIKTSIENVKLVSSYEDLRNKLNNIKVIQNRIKFSLSQIFSEIAILLAVGAVENVLTSKLRKMFQISSLEFKERLGFIPEILGQLVILKLIRVVPASGEFYETYYLTDLGIGVANEMQVNSNSDKQ